MKVREPSWPATFELLDGERASWGFPVGQAGPVQVKVQVQGGPVVVTLRKPDGSLVEQAGTNSITVKATASTGDVARGILWGLAIRTASDPPPAQGGSGPKALALVARGTVAVAHPTATVAQLSTLPIPSGPTDTDPQVLARIAEAHRRLAELGPKASKTAPPPPGALKGPTQARYWLVGHSTPAAPYSDTWRMQEQPADPYESNGDLGLIHRGDLLAGRRGDDTFVAPRLSNGWVVDRCDLVGSIDIIGRSSQSVSWAPAYSIPPGQDAYGAVPWLVLWTRGTGAFTTPGTFGGGANATVVDCPTESSIPYVKVHWWVDAGATVYYNVLVTIRGPAGLPYR